MPTKILKLKILVILVYKRDSKLDWNNYRPISLLLNTVNVIKKLLYNKITEFLNNNNLIYRLQFGFS